MDTNSASQREIWAKLFNKIKQVLSQNCKDWKPCDIIEWGSDEIRLLQNFIDELVNINIQGERKRNQDNLDLIVLGIIGSTKIERPKYADKFLDHWISESTIVDILNYIRGGNIQKFKKHTKNILAITALYDGWNGFLLGRTIEIQDKRTDSKIGNQFKQKGQQEYLSHINSKTDQILESITKLPEMSLAQITSLIEVNKNIKDLSAKIESNVKGLFLSEYFEIAVKMNGAGKFSECIFYANKILRQKPDCIPAKFIKAVSLYNNKSYSEALLLTEGITKHQSHFGVAHHLIGSIYLQQKKYKKSAEVFTELIKLLNDKKIVAWIELIDIYFNNENWSLKFPEKISEEKDLLFKSLLAKSRIQSKLTLDFKNAIKTIDEALQFFPDNILFHQMKADSFLYLLEFDNCIEYTKNLLEKYPEDAELLYLYASAISGKYKSLRFFGFKTVEEYNSECEKADDLIIEVLSKAVEINKYVIAHPRDTFIINYLANRQKIQEYLLIVGYSRDEIKAVLKQSDGDQIGVVVWLLMLYREPNLYSATNNHPPKLLVVEG